jgi:hypothetical protein
MRSRLLLAGLAGLMCLGCNEPKERLNAPPHGTAHDVSDLQAPLVYMTDNALLADMTISDMHFLPHRRQLSDLGQQRLSRLISLIQTYGGTIRLSSDVDDAELLSSRAEEVREQLTQAGVDTSSEVLREDISGGRGMDASEVILIKANEGTYKKKAGAAAGSSGSAGSASATGGSGK